MTSMADPRTSHRNGTPGARATVPFIVGVGRSGTTLLRLMLDAHPAFAIPPETHFVPELIALFKAVSSQANSPGV